MLICPNCFYQNPDGIAVCEACCYELSDSMSCSTCGESCLPDAKFCGSCGSLLQSERPDSLRQSIFESESEPIAILPQSPISQSSLPQPSLKHGLENQAEFIKPWHQSSSFSPQETPIATYPKTKLQDGESQESPITQLSGASLWHLQSDFRISLNMEQPVIHIGKPNLSVRPDINLAEFSNAEVVSRIHADIRIENNHFYIEDKGSCNGTFLNNMRIHPGEKRPLTPGDKITLGKGNLVSFIFELS